MRKIWIVNYYTTPPQDVSNPRHIKIAQYLMEKGFDVTVFCSNYNNRKQSDYIENCKKYGERVYDGIKFIHIDVCKYGNSSLLRAFSIFQFGYRLLRFRKKFEKPDIIYQNIHNPFDFLVSTCALRLKSKYIAEAWDLWPAAMVVQGILKENSIITKLAYHYEYLFYRRADAIILTMEGGEDYFRGHKWSTDVGGKVDLKRLYSINNGVDIDEFDKNVVKYDYHSDELSDGSLFKVVYLGSIKLVNNVKQIVEAAACLREYKDIMFYIFGDGYERDALEEYCQDNSINNVKFMDKRVPFEYVPSILVRSSVNLLNYRKITGKMGMSSGKYFLYLASGKPICSNIEPSFNLIKDNNLGVSKTFLSAQEYANAILSIYNLSADEYDGMCKRVRKTAEMYDYNNLCKRIYDVIHSLES